MCAQLPHHQHHAVHGLRVGPRPGAVEPALLRPPRQHLDPEPRGCQRRDMVPALRQCESAADAATAATTTAAATAPVVGCRSAGDTRFAAVHQRRCHLTHPSS